MKSTRSNSPLLQNMDFTGFKWIGSLVLIVLFSNCNNSEPKPNPVKNKKTIQFEEQWIQPPDYDTILLSYVKAYNTNGKPIEKSEYSRLDGSLVNLTKWTYDEHNNVTSKTTQNLLKNTLVEESFLNKYDEKGRKVHMLEKNPNSDKVLEHIYHYHDDGSYTDTVKYISQVLSIMQYNKNDEVLNGINFRQKAVLKNEYDEYGNATRRKKVYQSKRIPTDRVYINEYDSAGNLIRVTLERKQRTYEYNENVDVIKETWLDNDQIYRTIHYKYKYYD